MAATIELRTVSTSDLPIFFEQQLDPGANHMAAFTSRDPTDWEAFHFHWQQVMTDPTVTIQTIIADGEVAGHIVLYEEGDEEYDVGYWLGRAFWGQGIATAALRAFLARVPQRPLHARVVTDNIGSRRVLEHNGFRVIGVEREYATARSAEVDEYVLRLD